MTSVEFVIWLRGYLTGRPGYESPELRKQLALVDGVPSPAEERTTLTAPRPVRHDYTDLLSEFGFHQFADLIAAVLDKNWPADIFTGESGDAGPAFVVEVRAAYDKLVAARNNTQPPPRRGAS